MKKIIVILISFIVVSCGGKDEAVPEVGLSSFEVEGEIAKSAIGANTINVVLGNVESWTTLRVKFETQNLSELFYDSQTLKSGESVDLTKNIPFIVRTATGVEKNYSLELKSVLEPYGLGNRLEKGKSLNKSYNYYHDQFGTGLQQYENCGPAVATMALKWIDSTFAKSVSDARAAYSPNGGWWYTYDISMYLSDHGIPTRYAPLERVLSVQEYGRRLMQMIDKGYPVILCLDMYYIQHNASNVQRTNKFYSTANTGWGHFVLVKGYRVVNGRVWMEVYDPYSLDQKYEDGSYKGRDRFYSAEELKKATDIWWASMIVIPPDGNYPDVSFGFKPDEIQGIVHQKGGLGKVD